VLTALADHPPNFSMFGSSRSQTSGGFSHWIAMSGLSHVHPEDRNSSRGFVNSSFVAQ
jgi:hypothetical protein